MRLAIKCTVLSINLCFLFTCMAFAQSTGSLRGDVTDASGAVISGASVNVLSQETGTLRTTTTDASGNYIAPFLPVSIYTIEVEYSGFVKATQKDIRLQTDESRRVDFTLVPLGEKRTIQVTANPVEVET